MLNDGIISCARYAFMPNKLSYCGPDKNRDLFEYSSTGLCDAGLIEILEEFKTMFPYLNFIALANKIADPFDKRVVEAYWLGNNLLKSVSAQKFYDHLIDDQEMKRRTNLKDWSVIENKLAKGAKPTHNFHVFNVFMRTGNLPVRHTLETMDACRISWGKIIGVETDYLLVETEPLVSLNNRLSLGSAITKKVLRQIEGKTVLANLKIGDLISIHWNWACEKINLRQKHDLDLWTKYNLALFNS